MNKQNKTAQDAIKEAREQAPKAPAFLKTRIFTAYRERQRSRKKFFLGTGALATSFCLALVLFANIFITENKSDQVFLAVVNSPVAIKYPLDKIANSQFVKVSLGEGVYFRSQQFDRLLDRSLVLDVSSFIDELQSLPVVVESNEEGVKEVMFEFYDMQKNLIKTDILKVRFQRT